MPIASCPWIMRRLICGANLGASSASRARCCRSVDGLLAATALRHGLHIMTHTTPQFAATGVLIVDPWKESESEHQSGNEKADQNKIDSDQIDGFTDESKSE